MSGDRKLLLCGICEEDEVETLYEAMSKPILMIRNVVASQESRDSTLKQQRLMLLLLQHGYRCKHDGPCPVTSYCVDMKRLLQHTLYCKVARCQVSKCHKSRYLLSHYSYCRESTCPVCGPVREAIRRQK
jgi:E1A/CREB-binding protein